MPPRTRLALAMTGDHHDAADLVQEVLVLHRLGAIVVSGVLVTSLAACSGWSPERPDDAPAAESPCAGVRAAEECRSATDSSGAVVRYARIDPAGGPTEHAALVDLGGPGTTLFGMTSSLDSLRAVSEALGTTVLSLEEPWVMRDYSVGCRAAASSWFAEVHTSVADPRATATFVSTCDLGAPGWGWSKASYERAVKAVASAESTELEQFVGASFGAVRLTYLDSPPPEVVLVSPYYPGGDASNYLDSRGSSVAQYCEDQAVVACTEPLPADEIPDGRSLAVTAFDLGAAWLATSYQSDVDGYREVLAAGDDGAVAGALSDSVTGRFGATDVSPSTLAYFSELCPVFSDWTAAVPTATSALLSDQFLARWHSVCGALGDGAAAEGTPWSPPADRSICVVAARDDPVVPSRVSHQWRDKAQQYIELEGEWHGVLSAETLGSCS